MEDMKILSEFKKRFPCETYSMTDAEIIDTWKNTLTWTGLGLNLALNDLRKSFIDCFIPNK